MKDKTENYTSCIKINGVPILPPLMSVDKRKESQRYKRQAIKFEKRLRREKELRTYIQKYYLPRIDKCDEVTFPAAMASLEHQLSFIDGSENEIGTTIDNIQAPPVNKKLTRNIQVSQYVDDEFAVVANLNEGDDSISQTHKSTDEKTLDQTEQPRLIRSNSYTLETWSPVLLEHLKKQDRTVATPTKSSKPTDSHHIQLNLPEEVCMKETKPNLETSFNQSSGTESELVNLSDTIHNTSIEESSALESESKLKAFIDNNIPQNSNPIESKNPLDEDVSSECKLKKILDEIPEIYSKQILDLLEKQGARFETSNAVSLTHDAVAHLKDKIEMQNPNISDCNYSTPEYDVEDCVTEDNTLYYSTKSLDEELMNEDDVITYLSFRRSQRKMCQRDRFVSKENFNCSKELFPLSLQSKQDWAASIIGSVVKGYLTRRLLRTDRVQGLIQTIKDTLICAMQLHTETSDTIKESEVELHRRLIQQVSAACYAFHDVFFKLTPSEQMDIIRTDRQRQKDKLKRSASRSSSARTPKSTRSVSSN